MTGLRSLLFDAVPKSLRAAISVGIGFFITMIGLKIGQITRITVAPWAIPIAQGMADCYTFGSLAAQPFPQQTPATAFCNTAVNLNFSWYDNAIAQFNITPAARIAVLGLVFVSGLECIRCPGSIIISIVLSTFVGINYWQVRWSLPRDALLRRVSLLDLVVVVLWQYPYTGNIAGTQPQTACTGSLLPGGGGCVTDLSVWGQKGGPIFPVNVSDIPSGKLSFKYANKGFFWSCVWTFLFVELFDSFGTLTGIMTKLKLLGTGTRKDNVKGMAKVNRAMLVDGFSLIIGGIIGGNSCTCYIESNTGIEAGARTGLASIFTGGAFLMSLAFLLPFVQIIPDPATTCALVMVGVFSLSTVVDVNFNDTIDTLAAFFTIAIMGFTYSIANGICAGFIFFSWMRIVRWVHWKIVSAPGINKPEWGPRPGLEKDLPHPMMIIMAIFMAVRFAVLKA